MKDIGKTIKCTEKVFLNGRMAEYMRAIMSKTKNMALVEYSGPMERYTKDNGNKAFSMVRESIREKMGYGDKVIGRMAKELDEL